ncbi:actin-related protein, putative [Plasmodium vivax]|uniref:Actin-related protein, putative n=1 Tax=Plasmodium vivax TaxID=5855 RepID=A0A1G4GS97_PLAVI|nr:actin-related protein, putative [Plasmodium vivax]
MAAPVNIDVPKLILDNGGGLIKGGVLPSYSQMSNSQGDEIEPKFIVPNCVGQVRKKNIVHISDGCYSICEYFCHRPHVDGLLLDLEMQTKIWERIFSCKQTVGFKIKDMAICITESYLTPAYIRQGVIELLFEYFNFNQIVVVSSQTMLPFSFIGLNLGQYDILNPPIFPLPSSRGRKGESSKRRRRMGGKSLTRKSHSPRETLRGEWEGSCHRDDADLKSEGGRWPAGELHEEWGEEEEDVAVVGADVAVGGADVAVVGADVAVVGADVADVAVGVSSRSDPVCEVKNERNGLESNLTSSMESSLANRLTSPPQRGGAPGEEDPPADNGALTNRHIFVRNIECYNKYTQRVYLEEGFRGESWQQHHFDGFFTCRGGPSPSNGVVRTLQSNSYLGNNFCVQDPNFLLPDQIDLHHRYYEPNCRDLQNFQSHFNSSYVESFYSQVLNGNYNLSLRNPCALYVDVGFSHTYVLPYIEYRLIEYAILRTKVSASILNTYLKNVLSYKHVNLEHNELLVENVKERACYVSLDYERDLERERARLEEVKRQRVEERLAGVSGEVSGGVSGGVSSLVTGEEDPPKGEIKREGPHSSGKDEANPTTGGNSPQRDGRKKKKRTQPHLFYSYKLIDYNNATKREISDVYDTLRTNSSNDCIYVDSDWDDQMEFSNHRGGAEEGRAEEGKEEEGKEEEGKEEEGNEHGGTAGRDDHTDRLTNRHTDRHTGSPHTKAAWQRPSAESKNDVINLTNERIAIPEVLFNPKDINLEHCSIVELIYRCISLLPKEIQRYFLAQIYISGGSTKFTNFKHRLYKELRGMFPSEWDINIYSHRNGLYSNYIGTYVWLSDHNIYSYNVITREQYFSHGQGG